MSTTILSKIRKAAALPVLCCGLLTSCAAPSEDAAELGVTAGAIVNGETSGMRDEEKFGLVYFYDAAGNFVCSGSAVTDRWIVTAAHCNIALNDWVKFLGNWYQVDVSLAVTPGGQQEDDMAVARITTGLLRPDGSAWAPTAEIFGTTYPPEPRAVADNFVSMACFGASPHLGPNTELYRTGFFTAVRGTSQHLVELQSNPAGSQLIAKGDSGGPCFRFDTGTELYVGLNDLIAHMDPDGSVSDGQLLVFTQSKVDWIAGRIASTP